MVNKIDCVGGADRMPMHTHQAMRKSLTIAIGCLLLSTGAASPSRAADATVKKRAHPACTDAHCRASWTLHAGKTRTVQSPKAMRAGMLVSFNVYANGRLVHERAHDIEAVTLMSKDMLAVVESPADAPLKARLANFSDRPVRVTIEYWQSAGR